MRRRGKICGVSSLFDYMALWILKGEGRLSFPFFVNIVILDRARDVELRCRMRRESMKCLNSSWLWVYVKEMEYYFFFSFY